MTEFFTSDEIDLIRRLSSPPKCMHPFDEVIDLVNDNSWKYKKCGLVAPKVVKFIDGVLIK